jgi:hypothetical protein
MTGRCYACADGRHEDCLSLSCTCCGKRNREHEREVSELVGIMRAFLQETGFYGRQKAGR